MTHPLASVADFTSKYLGQTITAADTTRAQACLDVAVAVVESYCGREFDGSEDRVDAVRGVVWSVAARRFDNPAERASYTGPGPDGYGYTPAQPAVILTGQEMATLDRFRLEFGFA